MANIRGIFVIQFLCLAVLAKGAPVEEASSGTDGSDKSRRSYFMNSLEDRRVKSGNHLKHEGKRMTDGNDKDSKLEEHNPIYRDVQSDEIPTEPVEKPDFFKLTADQVAEQLKKELTNTMLGEMYRSRSKRAEGEEGGSEDSLRPEMHFSTLRAQASGSALPSPTMFVGGFSFMMMPSPDGEQVFSKVMENLPNLASPGGK